MPTNPKLRSLLRAVDDLIDKHAKDNADLRTELQKLRDDLHQSAEAGRWQDVARTSLLIASLCKFLYDLYSRLPPPH